jgi:predicted AAA+ superfamily ATPase
MSDPDGASRRYIRDVEQHNPWWEHRTDELDRVTELAARSDLVKFLDQLDAVYRADSPERRMFGIYGQTGIGKTTLLEQFVASVLDDDVYDYTPGEATADLVGSVPPSQVLYVPLEESLYHLESGDDALRQLERVADYFRSRIARTNQRQLVLLDDVGALDIDFERDGERLLDLVAEDTFLVLTGTTEAEVSFAEGTGLGSSVTPMLPMKFADYLEYRDAEGARLGELASLVADNRYGEAEHVRNVRAAFEAGEPREAVAEFETLCFETFGDDQRQRLHELAREYLRDGGLCYRSTDAELVNDLVRSHFLLYLYKEVAGGESIKAPRNLHRLCSMGATSGTERRYREIAETLGVDRRTVDTYLDILDEALILTESTDYALRRHRRTRLFLRDPRHVILLSQRQAHRGFEQLEGPIPVNNFEFERTLARTVGFDHTLRLIHSTNDTPHEQAVEYTETDAGVIDYVVRYGETVIPFVLAYHPYDDDPEAVAAAFDPATGQHEGPGGTELHREYEAPVRFVLTDGLPTDVRREGSLARTLGDGTTVCHLPFWLYLLAC